MPTKLCHTIVPNMYHFAVPVHLTTGKTISNNKKLATNNVTHDILAKVFGKEFGNLAQGDSKTKTIGTNSIFVRMCEHIKNNPNTVVTYA